MGKRKARRDEIEAAAAAHPRKSVAMKKGRTRTGGSSTSSTTPAIMCDDVLRAIFARVPARTAVASMALSKHHHRLMCSPDFRALHCRLAPPLPHPHIAYVATADVWRMGGHYDPISGYVGFRVATAGGGGGSNNAPMRALTGPAYLENSYVNTCNGVVLLTGSRRPSTCVLWNPSIADQEKEVTVPVSGRDDCSILGLGYGPRTKTYKLLLTRRHKMQEPTICRQRDGRDPGRYRERDDERERDRERVRWSPKELLVYDALGSARRKQPRLRTLLSSGLDVDGEISHESLYIGGTVYLLHLSKSAILAIDVDDETVTTIDLPGECEPRLRRAMSALLLLSGRPCVGLEEDGDGIALWLLTAEHQWEPRCVIDGYHINCYSIAGAWDCGGVLFMYLCGNGEDDKLFMYRADETKKKLTELTPPGGCSDNYALCWGYKPTLVSPGSIVGEPEQDGDGERRRDHTANIMAALKPVHERDRRVGQEATLDTVCFMEFLLRIMRALPENMQDVIGMPLLKPQGSQSSPHSNSDSDTDSRSKDGFYLSDY